MTQLPKVQLRELQELLNDPRISDTEGTLVLAQLIQALNNLQET